MSSLRDVVIIGGLACGVNGVDVQSVHGENPMLDSTLVEAR
jgi:hypothetical protein